jgi:hypothetical protein
MTITFSGITDTSVTPTVTYVAANGTVDDGTPGNEVANGENAVSTDGVGPTVTITSSSGSSGNTVNSSTLSYTATFSESVSNFDITDITVSGTANSGTPIASNFAGSGATYTFDVVKGTSDGTISVSVSQNKARDVISVNNKNTISNTYTLTVNSLVSNSNNVPNSSGPITVSQAKSNTTPSLSVSISKVGTTSTNGDTGFGGILKNGPTTNDTTKVINSGETIRLKINLSDVDGLSEINQIGIHTNFKKESNNPNIPYATIIWATFHNLAVHDKDGIFSDVKTQTVEFDGELILFVDITFDGFMDTTDLEIRASDRYMARMIETYEDIWTLNPPIIVPSYAVEFSNPEDQSTKEKVPAWVKNNAEWWAQDQINEETFVNGIEFLVNNDIINVPKIQTETKQKPSFVDQSKDPQHYIDRYFNELTYKEWFDNNYSDYTIYEAVGIKQPIPNWVKNNAEWWAQGIITENDFLQGIEYLVKKSIIDISFDYLSK